MPASPPLDDWRRSGLPLLCGWPAGPPVLPAVDLPAAAASSLLALRALAPEAAELARLDGPALLGERASLLGLTRRGRFAPSGACRLLRAADGWLALSLARGPEDRRLLPAWLECEPAPELVGKLSELVCARPRARLLERGRLLGLALAEVSAESGGVGATRPWLIVEETGSPARRPVRAPCVVDLSSLWAGPLCADLLRRAGAQVVKVESLGRPDGARFGPPRFFDLMNAGKASVALAFDTVEGRAALVRLLDAADVVIEASRPRALAQLGIDAGAWVAARPGRTWLSITGYGRRGEAGGWAAFGDDAAASAGLPFCVADDADPPVFVGDAVADPLTGIHAALAVLASWRVGGGRLLDLALASVVASVGMRLPAPRAAHIESRGDRHELVSDGERVVLARAATRKAPGRARALGADTARVLEGLPLARV